MKYTVTKYAIQRPVSIESLFDNPREGIGFEWDGGWLWFVDPWPSWLKKEWFKRGHGEGKRGPKGRLP